MLRLTYGRSSALLVALLSLVAVSLAVGTFSGNATLATPASSWDADIFHLPPSGKCIVLCTNAKASDYELSLIDYLDALCLAFV
jgi:hypothetical protein